MSLVDRISFPTEYNNKDELKSSIVLLFITCLLFFILSSIMIIFNLFLFSKTLLLGTIAYEFILFYLLNEYTKKFIETNIKKKQTKKTLSATSSIIFGALILLTFLTLIYTMITPTPLSENKFISLTISLLIIVSPTFFWHELVIGFKKKGLKKLKLIGLLLLLTISCASAQNETINETNPLDFFTTLTSSIQTVQKGIDYFNQFKTIIANAQVSIQSFLNLTPEQTQIVMLIGILIGAFLLLKFLSFIVKWVIVILIAWVIIQMILL